jgi:hypothetical protein
LPDILTERQDMQRNAHFGVNNKILSTKKLNAFSCAAELQLETKKLLASFSWKETQNDCENASHACMFNTYVQCR